MSQQVEDILAGGAAHLTRWLDSRGWTTQDDRNLALLAEASGQMARSVVRSDRDNSLLWARASIRLYERLHSRSPQLNFNLSAMMLRAFMIAAYGPKDGDEVLDPRILEDWFYTLGTDSPEAAVQKAAECWYRIANEGVAPNLVACLAHSRALKNAIGVLEVVGNLGVFTRNDDIRRWFEVKELLP